MDVTFSGPFHGIFTVKNTMCQIEVRLMDKTPIMFFVPYGQKCGIKVDRYVGGRLFAEQVCVPMTALLTGPGHV